MTKKAQSKKFSWKNVAKLVAAGLLIASLAGGGKYWYDGHPRYPVGTCLSGDGIYVKIMEIKDGKYIVLAQIPGLPMIVMAEADVRKFNKVEWTEIDCATGEPTK